MSDTFKETLEKVKEERENREKALIELRRRLFDRCDAIEDRARWTADAAGILTPHAHIADLFREFVEIVAPDKKPTQGNA